MLGSVLSTLHVLIHLILTVAYEVGTIILEEAEAQSVCGLPKVTQPGHKSSRSGSWGWV